MKTTVTTTPATVAPVAEMIRPVNLIEKDFTIEGDRVTMKKGAQISASEFALFISDRENTGTQFRTQARWAYYEAGRLSNGTEIQTEIAKRLESMLSKSALYQLKSEATTLCPLVIAEGLKSPLSILKDAVKELATNDAGKLKPMKDQTKAAKELIPLLKAGAVTQAKVREIRQKHKVASVTTPSTPTQAERVSEADKVIGGMQASLSNLSKALDSTKLEGEDRDSVVNILTDIARKLGLSLVIPGAIAKPTPAKPAPAATPAPAPAQPAPAK